MHAAAAILAAPPPIDTTVAVEVPEQIRFHFRVAGPAQRAAAWLIDFAVWLAILAAIVVLVGLFVIPFEAFSDYAPGTSRIAQGVLYAALFVMNWGYFALFEGLWRGQTPGKRVLALRVVKSGGEPVGMVDTMLRNLLRAADLLPLPYVSGVATMLVDSRFRRLGDLVAGTMVICEDRLVVAVPLQIHPPTADESARLPARVLPDADELRAVEMFLRRAPRLGPALSRELAQGVASKLGAKYGVRHADPVRLLALFYLRATAPIGSHNPLPGGPRPENGTR